MWWFFYVSANLSLFFFSCFFLAGSFLFLVLKESVSVLISWEICFLSGVSFDFPLIFDWVSLSFGCVVLLISACVMLFTCEYMGEDPFLSRFSWLVFLFVLSMSFVIFVPNLVAVLLGWDGLGLVSFLLVIYYQNYKSLSGGLITVLMNRVGDVAILLSIGFLVKEGCFSFFYVSGGESYWMICSMLLLAGMTKSAQIPFSSWLPAAMAAPTPVSALVHSSTLVTAGVFLLVRFFYFLSSFYWFKPLLLLISVVTMLMAGIAANLENDLKKIVALSTLSQLGVMMSSLGLGMWKLALFHLYTHALFKALLFLCAGSFIHRSQHGQDLRLVGSVWGQVPVIVSCFHVSNLALCGAPFLAGFYSKDLILEFSLFSVSNLLALFMFFLATGLTVSYSTRLSLGVLWNSFNFYSCHNWSDEKLFEVVPMMILVIGAVTGGSFFMWVLFYDQSIMFLADSSKSLTLIVVTVGGFMGWMVNSGGSLSEEKGAYVGKKGYFGLVYMWFLVHLSGQGVLEGPLKVGSLALYQGDRGWMEVIGGKGSLFFLKKTIEVLQSYGFNNILVYLGGILFSVFLFLVVFLVLS
uniref:NADH-ubiquinone oxidoreductase chain 5 n=1 Tax=Parborlasia corrugatus TaxID=187802 RepID=A0A3S8UZW6_PARCG|nr:NADH dehydrogenase subunit 5 [Parborlasia corrugatus]